VEKHDEGSLDDLEGPELPSETETHQGSSDNLQANGPNSPRGPESDQTAQREQNVNAPGTNNFIF